MDKIHIHDDAFSTEAQHEEEEGEEEEETKRESMFIHLLHHSDCFSHEIYDY